MWQQRCRVIDERLPTHRPIADGGFRIFTQPDDAAAFESCPLFQNSWAARRNFRLVHGQSSDAAQCASRRLAARCRRVRHPANFLTALACRRRRPSPGQVERGCLIDEEHPAAVLMRGPERARSGWKAPSFASFSSSSHTVPVSRPHPAINAANTAIWAPRLPAQKAQRSASKTASRSIQRSLFSRLRLSAKLKTFLLSPADLLSLTNDSNEPFIVYTVINDSPTTQNEVLRCRRFLRPRRSRGRSSRR